MLRKTLTILSLIGLLLSVGLWGVSYLSIAHGAKSHLISVFEGRIGYDHYSFERPSSQWYYGEFDSFRTRWWISYYHFSAGVWGVQIPLWMPSAPFAVFLMFRFVPLGRSRKRQELGLCLKCGYDLRASKDRCPECGEEFDWR